MATEMRNPKDLPEAHADPTNEDTGVETPLTSPLHVDNRSGGEWQRDHSSGEKDLAKVPRDGSAKGGK